MFFDNQSISLILLPPLWASFIVLLVNWRIHRTMPGVGWWPAGLVVTTAGFGIRAATMAPMGWIGVIAGSTLVVGGQLVMLYGLCRFAGRPMFTRAAAALLLVATAGMGLVLASGAPEQIRLLLVSTSWAAVILLQLVVLVELGRREGVAAVIVLAVSLALVALLFGVRLAITLGGNLMGQLRLDDGSSSLPRLLVFINSTMVAVLIAYGYVLLPTRRVKAQLAQLARMDMLTGAPNRLAFEEAMARLDAEAARSGRQVTLALLDIDRFKQINDTHGHAAGDAMLRHVATIIAAGLPPGAVHARVGGEEFALAMVAAGGPDGLRDHAERIRHAIAASPLPAGDRPLTATVSIGIATAPGGTGAGHVLHRRADEALYRAKSAGRNRVEVAAAA